MNDSFTITTNGLQPSRSALSKDDGTPPDEEQIAVCREWLQAHGRPIDGVNEKAGDSRALAWFVESWARKRLGDHAPIANGAFIEAARREGYEIRRTRPDSPSAYFNLMPKWQEK